MKETTGEFSMTVVTIVAVAAIALVITFLKDPLTNWINNVFEGQFGEFDDSGETE